MVAGLKEKSGIEFVPNMVQLVGEGVLTKKYNKVSPIPRETPVARLVVAFWLGHNTKLPAAILPALVVQLQSAVPLVLKLPQPHISVTVKLYVCKDGMGSLIKCPVRGSYVPGRFATETVARSAVETSNSSVYVWVVKSQAGTMLMTVGVL